MNHLLILLSFLMFPPTEPWKSKIKILDFSEDRTDNIQIAIEKTNLLLRDKNFYNRIANLPFFTHTIEHPTEIAQALKEAELILKVRGYKGGDGPTLAYVSSEHPNTIFVNVSKTGRSVESIAATLVHEIVHSVDRKLEDARFGHGGNSSEGKENSAPYRIGRLAEEIIDDDKKMGEECPPRYVEETENIKEDSITYGKYSPRKME